MKPDGLGLLTAGFDRARSAGMPQVVAVIGSYAVAARLIDDFLAATTGARVIRAGCSALTPSLGLGPLPEIVAALIGGPEKTLPPDLDPWIHAAVEDVLGRGEPRELGEIYGAVAHLVAAQARPVVVVVSDVHCAGHAFLNLVAFLAARAVPNGVLLVATATPGFPAGSVWPGATVVDLGAGDESAEPDVTVVDHAAIAPALATTFEGRTHPELVGAHFERAGQTTEAAGYFARAGHAAHQRGDMPSAADLSSRVARLLPPGDEARLSTLAVACDALLAIGRADRVVEVARAAKDEAKSAGDDCMVARFEVWTALMGPPSGESPPAERLDDAARVLARCDDALGRANVDEARAQLRWDEDDVSESMTLMDGALEHARASGDRPTTARIVVWLLDHSLAGPSDTSETAALCARLSWTAEWSALVEVKRLIVAAAAAAAEGRSEEAGASFDAATRLQNDIGQPGWVARVPQVGAWIDLVRDDAPAAEERVRGVFEELAGVGHPVAVESGVLLARALVRRGRFDEVVEVARECEQIATGSPPDEGMGPGEVAAVSVCALAHSGSPGEIDVDAVHALLPPPLLPIRRADALLDLAEAAATTGESGRARRLCDEAIALYEAKRAHACTVRARKALADFLRQV